MFRRKLLSPFYLVVFPFKLPIMKAIASLALIIFSCGTILAQNALSFDGIDDRVDCGNDASVQLSGSAITLEAWIYPTAWTSQVWQGNIINKENNSPDYGYMLRCGSGGQLNFNLGGGSWNELSTAANTLSLNTWQHVAGTYDGAMIRLYVNGIPVDSQAVSVSFSSGLRELTIGNWAIDNSRAFPGKIDEVRVWNVTRSRSEIFNNMNNEFCTAPSGLVAYYQLNEGMAGQANSGITTAPDLSANANIGSLQNFALSTSVSNWVLGSSINPASDFSQVVDSTCSDYIGPSGQIYDSTGVYIDTLQNSDGCDSIIETTLTVNSVNNQVNTTTNIMVAAQNNATYQWLDCNNAQAAVNGATGQLLSPPDPNGSYAVIVNYRGCVDTSDCYQLDGLSVAEQKNSTISVYPNPGKDQLTLRHPFIYRGTVQILSNDGRLIKRQNLSNQGETKVQFSELKSGVYIVRIADEIGQVQSLLWQCQ